MEQEIDRWIGTGWSNYIQDPEMIYMTDESYTEVSQAVYPGKVFWASGDHTAITTDQQGVFISKWNEYPLMRHAWNDSPYGASNLKYYKKIHEISGSTLICSGSSATFTIQNWQSSQTIKWIPDPYLHKTGESGNQATFRADGNGITWIDAKVNGTPLVRYNLLADTPIPGNITIIQIGYNNVLYTNMPNRNDAGVVRTNTEKIEEFEWSCAGWNIIRHPMKEFQIPDYSDVQFHPVSPQSNAAYVYIRARNACGWGAYKGPIMIDVNSTATGNPGYLSYPNPASNILNIEIDQEAITQAKSLEQTTLKVDPTYDIRLYDYQGNLLRQQKTKGGTVQFNVANLTNGIYYLHIYDGVNEKPEMRQIVVEH